MLINNVYGNNTFFVADLVFPNSRTAQKFLPAFICSSVIDLSNVEEHFSAHISCIKKISAVKVIKIWIEEKYKPTYKDIFKYLSIEEDLIFSATEPTSIIVEATCFDKPLRFYFKNKSIEEAIKEIKEKCNTAHNIRVLGCEIINEYNF